MFLYSREALNKPICDRDISIVEAAVDTFPVIPGMQSFGCLDGFHWLIPLHWVFPRKRIKRCFTLFPSRRVKTKQYGKAAVEQNGIAF